MAQNVPGRHRAPGRFNAISELKTIAKESAQPAMKGAAIFAASGGLIASFAGTANASDGANSVVAAVAAPAAAAAPAAPAAVGPAAGTLKAGNALSAIGYAKPALKQAAAKPVVIEDIQVKTERAEKKAAAERAAAEKAAEKAAKKAAAEQATTVRQATTTRTTRQSTSTRASRSGSTTRAALNTAPAPSASGIIGIAQSFTGVPYVYGGSTPSGFDCSGLTSYVYRQAGISIPRTASAQAAASTPVSSPRAGDLVFFGTPIYHVGIYVSPGRMIDAQRPGTVIGNHSIWTTPSRYGRI